jgi:hypothetical protein
MQIRGGWSNKIPSEREREEEEEEETVFSFLEPRTRRGDQGE